MEFLFTKDALITQGLIVLASFFNAVMDVIKHRWSLSIFVRIKPLWFRAWLGGKDAWGIETMDGWHTAKRAMLLCFFLAIVNGGWWPGGWLNLGIIIGVITLEWTLTFNWLYDHGLAKKPSKSNELKENLYQ